VTDPLRVRILGAARDDAAHAAAGLPLQPSHDT
jgi:hypothetical protein